MDTTANTNPSDPGLKELMEAINKYFGPGNTYGAVFFKHKPDGEVESASPIFMVTDRMAGPQSKPGDSIREMVRCLKSWGKALDWMGNDMAARTLGKN